MKKIILLSALLLSSVTYASQPPVHPSPQPSQDGKADLFESRPSILDCDFFKHYVDLHTPSETKLNPHAPTMIIEEGESQIFFGSAIVGKCDIICIMLNSATRIPEKQNNIWSDVSLSQVGKSSTRVAGLHKSSRQAYTLNIPNEQESAT